MDEGFDRHWERFVLWIEYQDELRLADYDIITRKHKTWNSPSGWEYEIYHDALDRLNRWYKRELKKN